MRKAMGEGRKRRKKIREKTGRITREDPATVRGRSRTEARVQFWQKGKRRKKRRSREKKKSR